MIRPEAGPANGIRDLPAAGRTSNGGGTTDLRNVTFVVFDLETTGTSPERCGITEVGAVRYRGGECQGTLSTLIDPGEPVPPLVSMLTGISDAMLAGAPPIAAVLPSFVEFLGDAVIVGHNVAFDLAFLNASLAATGRPPLHDVPVVDTLALARHLVRDEVVNCRLATLARHFRTRRQPCHRALADALATADVFHALVERVASFGVDSLEALLEFPAHEVTSAGSGTAG